MTGVFGNADQRSFGVLSLRIQFGHICRFFCGYGEIGLFQSLLIYIFVFAVAGTCRRDGRLLVGRSLVFSAFLALRPKSIFRLTTALRRLKKSSAIRAMRHFRSQAGVVNASFSAGIVRFNQVKSQNRFVGGRLAGWLGRPKRPTGRNRQVRRDFLGSRKLFSEVR